MAVCNIQRTIPAVAVPRIFNIFGVGCSARTDTNFGSGRFAEHPGVLFTQRDGTQVREDGMWLNRTRRAFGGLTGQPSRDMSERPLDIHTGPFADPMGSATLVA